MTEYRRDRTGELVEIDEPEPHDPECNGFAGEDWSGRPIPCPTCRPDLSRRLARQHAIASGELAPNGARLRTRTSA